MSDQNKLAAPAIASYLLVGLALLLVLQKTLLAAFFAGLLVFSLVHLMTPLLGNKISGQRAKMVAVAILSMVIVAALLLAIWGTVSFFQSYVGSLQTLLQKMADIIETSRHQIPPWLADYIPDDADALRDMIGNWLRAHAFEAKSIGQHAARTIVHILIGMVIGAMAALYDTTTLHHFRPLTAALYARLVNLHDAFRRIVFAQVRIAAVNAALTAIYLLIVLPLAGIHLPLAEALVAITFFAGLLPILGNLISNTIIVVVSLSYSLHLAVSSLLFLVTIHKLEYFLNAKIVGAHINARAWELLVAMLVMEAVFGVPGLIAAPVLYAYVKKELTDCGLV